MKENTLTSSSTPATWQEGCALIRSALRAIAGGEVNFQYQVEEMIQGAVTAAYCHQVVFRQGGSATARPPQFDKEGRVDTRYLLAKARAVQKHTQDAQKALETALQTGNPNSILEAKRSLLAVVVEQTQMNWYQRTEDHVYRHLVKIVVMKTLDKLYLEVGLSD